MVIRGNDISVVGHHRLSDYEIMTSFRGSRILRTYHFKDAIFRHTTSMGNTKRIDGDEADLKAREELQVYLRTIDRHMQNALGEQARWGAEDTYGHTRKPTKGAKNIDKGEGNDFRGTFRNNRNNYRCVNCAEWGEDPDNGAISTDRGVLLITRWSSFKSSKINCKRYFLNRDRIWRYWKFANR